jgi:hypothetical protein
MTSILISHYYTRFQAELEEAQRSLQLEERNRVDFIRQREQEIKEWKKMVEQELAESMKKLAEQELKRTEYEEQNRKMVMELDQVKPSF